MREPRTRKTKAVCALIAAQAICLAMGLILEHQYILAAGVAEVEGRISEGLTRDFGDRLHSLSALPWKQMSAGERDAVSRRFRLDDLEGKAALIVLDPDNRAVFSFPPEDHGASEGSSLEFIANAEQGAESNAEIVPGVLQRGGERFPAIALPRTDRAGTVVLRAASPQIAAPVASLTKSLTTITSLTWVWTLALLALASFLVISRLVDHHTREFNKAISDGLRQRQVLIRTRDAVIFGLAKLAESRDPDTGDHLDRISVYSTKIAETLSRHPDYKDVVTPLFVRTIGISSVLHDIGKVGIEDRILLKPGRFTAAERAQMQTHCRIAADCLREIEQRLGRTNFLEMAREIALCHHERWDGSGYPEGLRHHEIPLSARIVAIADVYDALSSRRVYKDALPHAECVEVIRSGAGTHFDPRLVEVWLSIADQFEEIARRYVDRGPSDEAAQGTRRSLSVKAHSEEVELQIKA